MEFSNDEIEGLMNLFNTGPRRRHRDSDDEQLDEAPAINTAENDETEAIEKKNPYAKLNPNEEKERIYEEIVNENDFIANEDTPFTDWKKTPKWELSYKQQVTPSDVFLQMGPKNPSTACCEDLIIEVWLPGDKRQNIDLKILNTQLKLISPHHVLDIPLPHPVDPQKGNAHWDNDNEKLIITLRMSREFDFVNF